MSVEQNILKSEIFCTLSYICFDLFRFQLYYRIFIKRIIVFNHNGVFSLDRRRRVSGLRGGSFGKSSFGYVIKVVAKTTVPVVYLFGVRLRIVQLKYQVIGYFLFALQTQRFLLLFKQSLSWRMIEKLWHLNSFNYLGTGPVRYTFHFDYLILNYWALLRSNVF